MHQILQPFMRQSTGTSVALGPLDDPGQGPVVTGQPKTSQRNGKFSICLSGLWSVVSLKMAQTLSS